MLKISKIVFLFIFYFATTLAYCQNEEFAERPKYAPRSEKDRNVTDIKGRQGVWKTYSWEGILVMETTYKNDIRHGQCLKYNSYTGLIREQSNYFFGKKDGEYKSYHINGLINSEGFYKNGKKSGNWITYYKTSGEKRSEGIYLNGKKSGFWTFYNSKGTKTASGNFQNDERVGVWESFNSEGTVTITNFVNGAVQLKETKKNQSQKI
jgi:antitoxin component YwqK of YwqJK toxin-antitoxin module